MDSFCCSLLYTVYEIELSHMGENNGNPDLVCERIRIHYECERQWGRKIRPEDHPSRDLPSNDIRRPQFSIPSSHK